MIQIRKISKTFGKFKIFDEVSLKISSKDRIGLVGKNGHGKTTLLKIISGQEDFDSGVLKKPKNYNIGFMKQKIIFSKNNIFDEGISALKQYDIEKKWIVEKILFGLGFSKNDMYKNPKEVSSGFQIRLNLAKILIKNPDMLLLDEPINYLDVSSVKWMEKFLIEWPKELILVSHNKEFMNKVVTHIAGIHRKKIKKIKGNTSSFYKQIEKEENTYEKTRINYEKKEKKLSIFIEKFRAKAKLASLVQSKIKTANKLKKIKLKKIKKLNFSFNDMPCSSKYLLKVENISFKYETQNNLFKNLNFYVKNDDRIFIIGKNGKGKSTLIKILNKTLSPTSGKIVYSPESLIGTFNETSKQYLNDNRSIEKEIFYSNENTTRYQARKICSKMMFEGNSALKKIKILSGGEKSRVLLGKLLVTPLNLLLLDEPTNHLDNDSCNALLSAINNFNGAVIMATHDEIFLYSIAKKLIVFKEKNIEFYNGNYKSFLNNNQLGKILKPCQQQKLNKKEIRKIRSINLKQKLKIIKPIKSKLERINKEKKINEIKLQTINKELIESYKTNDGKLIQKLSKDAFLQNKIINDNMDESKKLIKEIEKIEANSKI